MEEKQLLSLLKCHPSNYSNSDRKSTMREVNAPWKPVVPKSWKLSSTFRSTTSIPSLVGWAVLPSVQPLGGLHTELRVCSDINVIYVSSFYSPTESNCSVLLRSSTLHQKGELNGAKGLTEGKDEGRMPPAPGRGVERCGVRSRAPGVWSEDVRVRTRQDTESGYRKDRRHACLLLGLINSASNISETLWDKPPFLLLSWKCW